MITVYPIHSWMANAYLLENESGLYLVDACSPGAQRQILDMIKALKKELRLIYITHAHFDHYGSAAAVQRLTGAKIAIHAADARAMALGQTPIRSAHGRGRLSLPFAGLVNIPNRRLGAQADALLQDGERLDAYGLTGRVLHTPGHTPGSTCLLVDNLPENGLLAFTGDLVTGGRSPALQRLYADDWTQLSQSLARLQAARPVYAYPGHGKRPIPADVLQQLRG